MQLLKMVSYASGIMTFREACDTVLELVEGISAVPVEILKSMSMAMVSFRFQPPRLNWHLLPSGPRIIWIRLFT